MSTIGRRLLRNKNYGLTPQEQSSEHNLQGKIVLMIPKENFWKFLKIINAIRKLIKFCILHPHLSLVGLYSKYFNIRSNTECLLKGHLSLGS